MRNPIAKAPDGSLIDFSQVVSITRLEPEDHNNVTNLNFKFYIYFLTDNEYQNETVKHTIITNNIDFQPEEGCNWKEIKEHHKEIYNKRWTRFMSAWKRYREHVAYVRETR